MDEKAYDVIIIGSGPAGLTAGIYTSRASLKTLVIAGNNWGGQLMLTTLVENYPGFADGIQGPELMANMRKQAEKFGVKFVDENATGVEFGKRPYRTDTTNGSYSGKAVIIATGAEFKWLGVPGESKLIGKGVSSCATCDAAFFKNKKVIVVGGGDAAMEEALVLAKYATEVTVVHRRDSFRASQIMQDRVKNHPKIKIRWNTVVTEIMGENKVDGVRLSVNNAPSDPPLNLRGGDEKGEIVPMDGVFVAIGHNPATKIFEGKIDLDEKGFVLKKEQKYQMMSNIDGVFIAGEVHDHVYGQVVTSAGYGCMAALEAEKWLDDLQT